MNLSPAALKNFHIRPKRCIKSLRFKIVAFLLSPGKSIRGQAKKISAKEKSPAGDKLPDILSLCLHKLQLLKSFDYFGTRSSEK